MNDDCVPTTYRLDKRGYGRANVKRFGRVIWLAHRVAWIDANGRLPAPGMLICHTCDNPSCVNPAHLYEGTPRDNVRDMLERGRQRNGSEGQTHCKRGHEFTEENTRLQAGTGARVCCECNREKSRERMRKHRARNRAVQYA